MHKLFEDAFDNTFSDQWKEKIREATDKNVLCFDYKAHQGYFTRRLIRIMKQVAKNEQWKLHYMYVCGRGINTTVEWFIKPKLINDYPGYVAHNVILIGGCYLIDEEIFNYFISLGGSPASACGIHNFEDKYIIIGFDEELKNVLLGSY